MPADKKPAKKSSGFGAALRRFAAPKVITGAGARRDKRLLEAERKGLNMKKKK